MNRCNLAYYKNFYKNEILNDEECGISSNEETPDAHIMGGKDVKYMQYPWICMIMHKEEDKWINYCGATLINSKYVIAAAHCFYTPMGKPLNFDEFKVVLGINNWKINETYRQDQPIKKVILHEKYDWESKINDICILQLTTPIDYQNTKIRSICLPEKNYEKDKVYEGEALTAGWGMTDMNNSEILKFVYLPIGNKSACIKELKEREYDKFLYKTTLCSINPDQGKDVCGGDSGGPLMGVHKENGKFYLRGVVSFGCFICAGFGGYSKISYFLDWIQKQICVSNRRATERIFLKTDWNYFVN